MALENGARAAHSRGLGRGKENFPLAGLHGSSQEFYAPYRGWWLAGDDDLRSGREQRAGDRKGTHSTSCGVGCVKRLVSSARSPLHSHGRTEQREKAGKKEVTAARRIFPPARRARASRKPPAHHRTLQHGFWPRVSSSGRSTFVDLDVVSGFASLATSCSAGDAGPKAPPPRRPSGTPWAAPRRPPNSLRGTESPAASFLRFAGLFRFFVDRVGFYGKAEPRLQRERKSLRARTPLRARPIVRRRNQIVCAFAGRLSRTGPGTGRRGGGGGGGGRARLGKATRFYPATHPPMGLPSDWANWKPRSSAARNSPIEKNSAGGKHLRVKVIVHSRGTTRGACGHT